MTVAIMQNRLYVVNQCETRTRKVLEKMEEAVKSEEASLLWSIVKIIQNGFSNDVTG